MPLNALGDLFNAVLAQAVAPPPPARMTPEKVAPEMIGRTFVLTEPFTSGATTHPKGTEVQATAWDNVSDTVTCTKAGPPPVSLTLPKTLLLPKRTPAAGIHPYGAGASAQAAVVKKAETTLADWIAKEDEYKKAGTTALWIKERDRQQDLLVTKRKALNQKLIQEMMFNRFDSVIKTEVALANTAAGLTGANALDANLLKSMLFQESELGTSGRHLEDPPSHPVKSRFNLGQVIDSSALALMKMFDKEQPAIVSTYFLGTLLADLLTAQNRHAELLDKTTRTPAEEAELTALKRKALKTWETFIWEYRAPGRAVGFWEAVLAFFASSVPPKNLDYTFWIHMAVLWLFEKKKPTLSWPDTIRAYNGGGPKATRYRDEVVKRAKEAAAAAKAGKGFIPRRA